MLRAEGGAPVLIGDVARVDLVPDERRGIADLDGEGDVELRWPRGPDVRFDLRPGIGVDHQDDRAESRGDGVRDQQVHHGLVLRSDGGEGLDAAEAPSTARGKDDERRTAQPGHLSTALAQVIPAPKPVSRSRSPSLTRPFSRASTRARGMDADEVLP